MSDLNQLVEALRLHATDDMGREDVERVHVATQAADEIERLRGALQAIANGLEVEAPCDIARKTLDR